MQPPAGGAPPSETHRFPCPACGADLRFEPATTRLACGHCGHAEPIPDRREAIHEIDLRAAVENALPPAELEEVRIARCESCGAEIEFDAEIHARECPFCAAPIVTDTGAQRQIKPQAQLPFLVTEAEARASWAKWLRGLWFAPSDLTRLARSGRAMQGVYAPYWTYDAETATDYAGQRGDVYHESRPVEVRIKGKRTRQMRQVARVRWTRRRGSVARDFDDVLVLGARSLPKRLTDALAPWDLVALSAYEPRYLAGFRAEGYTVAVDAAFDEARALMNAVIEADVRRDIGGDQQRIEAMETRLGRVSFKHVLLPVWSAAYRYRGAPYRFVVNGRTGQVAGERPWSAVKIALAVLAGLLVAVALAYLQIAQS